MDRILYRCIAKTGLFWSVVFFIAKNSYCQPFIGQINSRHFSKQQYGAGSQNWAIRQDKEGRIYFANNEGVLTYDGINWQVYPLPNKTIVRYIEVGPGGRIYAGGQDELGYFEPDKSGQLVYTSLVKLIESTQRQFADIWNIAVSDNDVFFRSSSKLFQFRDDKITVYQPSGTWEFLGSDNKRVIAQDKLRGLLELKNNRWDVIIDNSSLPADFKITAITSYKNKSLLTTEKNGLYILSGNQLLPFALTSNAVNNRPFFTCVQTLVNGDLLLGTYENGIYHADSTGQLIEVFTKNNGLQNNEVKYIFEDRLHNIWAGLDNGISLLEWNNAIKQINPDAFNNSAGYACALSDSKIFFALANGIYDMPLQSIKDLSYAKNELKKIAGGLSWKVANIKGHLFAGRDDGFYEIKNDNLFPVNRSTGYWTFQSLPGINENLSVVAGNYLGISIYQESEERFINKADLTSLNTSSRFLAFDSLLQSIWVSHPYRGVYKISIPANNTRLYTTKDGLPSDLNNHVFKIKNQVLIATTKGIYVYNPSANRFELSNYYDNIFHGISLRYLQDDRDGNLWFVSEKNLGVVDYIKKAVIYFPEVKGKILSGFEFILPVDSANVFVGGEAGFFHINYAKYKLNLHAPEVYIRNVSAKSKTDSLLFGGFNAIGVLGHDKPGGLSHIWNSFHFEFSSAYYEQPGNAEYSYQLKGFDDDWSEWTKKTDKDYTNIPPGDYLFQVKVRNNLGQESPIVSYRFAITPPWYNSFWAWLLYSLLAIVVLYAFGKWREKKIQAKQELKIAEQKKRFEEEQKRRESMHQLELEKSEKELIKLKNEKLESEIEFKNAELAAIAMNLVQKKEFLVKIKDELHRIKKPSDTNTGNVETSDLNKLLRSLNEQVNLGDEWEQFSLLFNKLHHDFLITLKEKHPNLTSHELKLCAYLRMNLSSKEIAHLMSISVRGVEISRYRLRKKLPLSPKEDLFQFLFNLEAGSQKKSEVGG